VKRIVCGDRRRVVEMEMTGIVEEKNINFKSDLLVGDVRGTWRPRTAGV
jgi:hypothetical protein